MLGCQDRPGEQSPLARQGTAAEQIQRLAGYESLAPPTVSEGDLKQLYPDLMEAYDRLRLLTRDMLKAADHLTREIQRLESQHLHRRLDGGTGEAVVG